jgi:hypothetical protein
MNDSVFHARRRISVSGMPIDLVLDKKTITPFSYEEEWYFSITDTEGNVLVQPVNLGVMVARTAVTMAEQLVRKMIVGECRF